MIPEYNNVYLTLAPVEPERIVPAIEEALGAGTARLGRSTPDGAERIRIETDTIDLDSIRFADGSSIIFGGVAGSPEEVAELLDRLSQALAGHGIEHDVELYDSEGPIRRAVREPAPGLKSQ